MNKHNKMGRARSTAHLTFGLMVVITEPVI
jgi:hypothetical protein